MLSKQFVICTVEKVIDMAGDGCEAVEVCANYAAKCALCLLGIVATPIILFFAALGWLARRVGIIKRGGAIMAIALCGGVMSAENLVPLAEDCLDRFSTTKDDTAWLVKWDARWPQMLRDDDSIADQQGCAERAVTEWFRGGRRVERLERGERLTMVESVEVCRWYLLFRKREMCFPPRVGERVTLESFKKYLCDDMVKILEK